MKANVFMMNKIFLNIGQQYIRYEGKDEKPYTFQMHLEASCYTRAKGCRGE